MIDRMSKLMLVPQWRVRAAIAKDRYDNV